MPSPVCSRHFSALLGIEAPTRNRVWCISDSEPFKLDLFQSRFGNQYGSTASRSGRCYPLHNVAIHHLPILRCLQLGSRHSACKDSTMKLWLSRSHCQYECENHGIELCYLELCLVSFVCPTSNCGITGPEETFGRREPLGQCDYLIFESIK